MRDDGARLVVDDIETAPGAGETISVAQGGVVVVTGGARGVTAISALALAARHGLRLALLGRTTLREAAPTNQGVPRSPKSPQHWWRPHVPAER